MIKKTMLSGLIVLCMIFTSIGVEASLEDGTRALLGVDIKTGDIAYSYNSDEVVEIASTTKLMTYLVIKDKISEGPYSLNDKVKIDGDTASIGGSSFNLREGEELTVDELLDALLIVSGNDACNALTKHFARDEREFVDQMNKKAEELGLETAVYYTTSGLADYYGRENKMSTEDIYTLAKHIIEKYPEVLRRSSKEELVDLERNYSEPNTNPLIGKIPEVDGLKTGYTNRAGKCLVATASGDREDRVIGIVMGTRSDSAREEKSMEFMNYILDEFERKTIYRSSDIVDSIRLGDSKYSEIDISTVEDVDVFKEKNEEVISKIDIEDNLAIPIEEGEAIGSLTLEYGPNRKTVDLTVSEDVTRFSMIRAYVSNFLKAIFN